MEIEEKTKTRQHRKSLAVDQDTYNLLEEICYQERRTKIDQLRMMIEDKHDEIFTRRANYEQRRRVNVWSVWQEESPAILSTNARK